MKKSLLSLLVAIIAVCSCGRHNLTDSGKAVEAIDNAKNEEVNSINEAKKVAIEDAKQENSVIVPRMVQSANADSSSMIDAAKDENQTSVQTSVDNKVSEKTKEYTKYAEAYRLVGIVGIIAVLALIMCVYLVIKVTRISRKMDGYKGIDYVGRDFKESVIRVIRNSERIRTYIAQQANTTRPTSSGIIKINGRELEEAVYKCVTGPQINSYLNSLFTLSKSQSNVTPMDGVKVNEQNLTPIVAESPVSEALDKKISEAEIEPEPQFELFARDSETYILTGVHQSFQKGKSIYKLMLQKKDERFADITLCIDQEGVQKRILNANVDMLTPVCSVQRKSSDPQKVVIEKKGRAEMTGQDSWKVTAPISVVLE